MKQKWWKALPMLLMMAVLGSGSVRTWKNLAVQAADAAALTTDMVETTAQESVPFYHGMINLNTFFQMTLGKNVIEDTAEGDEVVKLKNGYLTFVCEPADVTESARSLLSLQETCKENGAELYFVLTPQKISKYDPELPTGVQDNYNPMADAFLAQLGGQVHCTDLRQVIHENGISQYNFFFKTDHHWTPEGAFWCWGQVAQILKSEYGFVFDDAITNLNNYTVTTYPNCFLGSQGKRVGTVYAGLDDFSVITPNYAADFTLTVPDKGIDRSGDYVKTADLLRPGHADYTAYAKYHGYQDARGGGHFSGRVTAALVAGGALVLGALNRAGIEIVTHIGRCAGISDAPFALDDPAALAAQAEALLNKSEGFALLDGSVEEPMKAAIRAAGAEGDSVGGVLETAILGLPAGVGEPYFDSVESKLAHLAFSIPAVKGIEFGSGFGFADQKGSEANDAFRMQGERIVTATNHNAGLNGGISNGMPVVFRTAVKPTPSIYKTQDTVDYIAKKDAELSIQGRHDPCIVPRAAIVQTCAAALAVGDLLTAKYGMAWMEDPTGYRKEVL